MEKRAISKNVRISPKKAQDVIRLIRGRDAKGALSNLELMPRKTARMIAKTLRSAIANAENDEYHPVDAENLVIKEAVVNEGPTMKRFKPRARGMVGRIRKRSSHIRITVTDEKI